MSTDICQQLSEYYIQSGIHPNNFRCPNQDQCRRHAANRNMTEAKMSMVGSQYGEIYPKIVVVSLDPPSEKKDKFTPPHKRTMEYVTATHEAEDYTDTHKRNKRLNPHWAMTNIIVKDVLILFGYEAKPRAAVVEESYSEHPIENVTSYFAHVNVAKCSMNRSDKRQAPRIVHKTCSDDYLEDELAILQPEILITQGKTTNEIMGHMLIGDIIIENDLPTALIPILKPGMNDRQRPQPDHIHSRTG